VPDTKVLNHASLPSIKTIQMQSQLHWGGHVCLPDSWLPKKLLYGELHEGKCIHGGQNKDCKDTQKAFLKALLKAFSLNPDT